MSRPLHARRLLTGALILGAAGAALASGGPDALVPFKMLVASAADTVCMGAVIDYGTRPVPPSTTNPPPTVAQSISVAPGTSDEQALSDAGDTPSPNSSGLICAINGYPANGDQNCLGNSNGQYYYWSYWQGDPASNTWTYAQTGPASHTVNSGDTYVEGWRYQDPGPDNPSATKPSVTPATAFAKACPGITPVSSSRSTGSGTGTPSTTPLSTSTANRSVVPTTTTLAPSTSSVSVKPAGTPARGGITTTASSASPNSASTTTTTRAGQLGHPTKKKAPARALALPHRGHGGESLLPIALLAAVIVALGALATIRWRRRSAVE